MRFRMIASIAVPLLAVLALAGPGLLTAAKDYSLTPKIKRGLQIAPVKLNLRGKNRRLVGLGSYLVNSQAECVSCHTHPEFVAGHNPYLGERPARLNTANYLAGGEAFGPFVTTNLTPDANGNPGGLTYAVFLERIRTGQTPAHPQFGPFIQVMPWPSYREMSDQELRAIYEYLRAIPHAEPGASAAHRKARS